MKQKNKTREIKKELRLKCYKCQTIYQLLEIQHGNNHNCPDNCLTEWQQTLQDYHSKELMVDINKQEENE